MPGKVKNALPAEQYQKLLAELAALSAEPTLPQIQEVCGRFGIRVSGRGGATTVRRDFDEFVADLERKRQAAEMIAAAGQGGIPAAQAGLAVATEKILSRLMDEEQDDETLQGAVYALARAKRSDEDAKLLSARLADYEARLRTAQRKETEWNETRAKAKAALEGAKAKGGISKEALKRIEEAAAIL